MTEEQIIELMARAMWGECDRYPSENDEIASYDGSDDDFDMDRELVRDEARAALTALRSAGMAVVPREPTEAMYAAACDPQAVFKHTKPDERGGKIPLLPAVHYRAMINTAEGKTE